MAQFTVKNNLPGSLFIPQPIGKVIAGRGQISVEVPASEMEDPVIVDMVRRRIVTITSLNDPTVDDHVEDPTFGAIEIDHQSYDTLAHRFNESFFQQLVYTGADVTGIVTWTSAGMTEKIRESQFTYDSGGRVQTAIEIQYQAGVEVARITQTYAYNLDGSIASVTGVKT